MALICIDNCVELVIKTFLGLPKRLSGILGITRNRLEQISNNFPSLIDGLEELCDGKLRVLELGDIKWYYRRRNELYHKGNGITVEKTLVIAYAEIAKILLKNLFNTEIEITELNEDRMLKIMMNYLERL